MNSAASRLGSKEPIINLEHEEIPTFEHWWNIDADGTSTDHELDFCSWILIECVEEIVFKDDLKLK